MGVFVSCLLLRKVLVVMILIVAFCCVKLREARERRESPRDDNGRNGMHSILDPDKAFKMGIC